MRILILLLFPLFSYSQLSIGILESSRTLDPDAQAFITAAAITNSTQKTAINNLVIGLKADGLWNKMKAIYPMVGGTASSHKWNLKDPRDVDAAFRLLFVGGWTHSSTGALPNGTSGYAITYLTPSTTLSVSSSHLSFYSRSDIAASNRFSMGSFNAAFTSANQLTIKWSDNNLYTQIGDNASVIGAGNTNTTGFYITSRTASNLVKGYKNNSSFGSNTTSVSITNNIAIYIGARSDANTPVLYDNKECAFSSIGDGLNDTEAANFYSRVQAYQTALNRQIAP